METISVKPFCLYSAIIFHRVVVTQDLCLVYEIKNKLKFLQG